MKGEDKTRDIRRQYARRMLGLPDAQIEVYLDMDDLTETLRVEIETRSDSIRPHLRSQLHSILTTLSQYPREDAGPPGPIIGGPVKV
jgi:hypothetical protein